MRLDDRCFTSAKAARLSGVSEKDLENWAARGTLEVGEKLPSGRWLFSFLDILALAVMHGLTRRVPIGPRPAVQAAQAVAAYVAAQMPRDAAGSVLCDVTRIPSTQAIVLARTDDEWRCDVVAIGRGYADRAGPWSAAHIVVPIAELFADVFFRSFEMEAAQ